MLQEQLTTHAPQQSSGQQAVLAGQGFVKASGMILLSEIGDKTFFIAAIMAMKHRRISVRLARQRPGFEMKQLMRPATALFRPCCRYISPYALPAGLCWSAGRHSSDDHRFCHAGLGRSQLGASCCIPSVPNPEYLAMRRGQAVSDPPDCLFTLVSAFWQLCCGNLLCTHLQFHFWRQ